MNKSKRGQRLVEDVALAGRNAQFCFHNPEKRKKSGAFGTEEYYLKMVVRKANSRLKQIQEDTS